VIEITQIINFDKPDSTNYLALIITKNTLNHPEAVWLDNGQELENKYLKYYQNVIKAQKEDKYSYTQYWKKIQEKLNSMAKIRKVYFSPDGVYNQINLYSLFNPESQKYLIEELDIRLLSNPREVLSIRQNTLVKKEELKGKKAELFGFPFYDDYTAQDIPNYEKTDLNVTARVDSMTRFANFATVADLPGTKNEVESIKNILDNNQIQTSIHIRQKATEERIKSLKDIQILHIATHGFFLPNEKLPDDTDESVMTQNLSKLPQNPLLRAGLLLCGAKKAFNNESRSLNSSSQEDGILTAFEAMNLDLDGVEMVVLSACETGLGEVQNGEGVYGLQRAFAVAGAKSILMSLWTVSDEATQELMILFYQNWMQTRNKRQAFQQAQLKLKEKYPQPYFWSAFVMIGE
jgi:CHAT domain-containing protein